MSWTKISASVGASKNGTSGLLQAQLREVHMGHTALSLLGLRLAHPAAVFLGYSLIDLPRLYSQTKILKTINVFFGRMYT